MRWESRSELAVLVSTAVLCAIIFVNIANKLRKILPYRVNCWFCNGNTWVRFPVRNCWTCPTCEQYNGFTKDGDYNRPLPPASEPVFKTPRPVQRSPDISNGLCRMCNINQQLKVAQLANFVPMTEESFHREVTSYKSQLEKAYKLCARCRKVLKAKLHKEKETLLGSKLLESRSPKKETKNQTQSKRLKTFIKYFAMSITLTLLILITADCYKYIIKNRTIKTTILQSRQLVYGLFERLKVILKSKALLAFPLLRDYENISYPLFFDCYNQLLKWVERLNLEYLSSGNNLQELLGGIGCLTQIACHLLNKKIVKYQTVTDTLWAVLLVTLIVRSIATPILLMIKVSSVTALFILYNNTSLNSSKSIFASPTVSPKRMKNLTRDRDESWTRSDTDSELETDDDVSLSQYGVNNSASSNDARSLTNQSFISGRVNSSYNKKPGNLWNASLNSSYNCSSPYMNGSVSQACYSAPQTCYTAPQIIFAKPEFNSYQKMETNDSDSDLDEGINGLHLSTSPKKYRQSGNIFSIKKFDTISPRFAVPSLLHQRPLISPSKLGQGASWVAGGYWGGDGSCGLFDAAASRSSSQSSGFESQASGFTQRNIFSQPPSREDSVCSELDRTSIFSDPAPYKFGFAPTAFHQSQPGRLRSPVHPQMRYDGHIHIPLPLAPHPKLHAQYAGYHEPPRPHMFASPPNGSRLIKLPHVTD